MQQYVDRTSAQMLHCMHNVRPEGLALAPSHLLLLLLLLLLLQVRCAGG
jgi:hypothetical protein